MFDCIYEVDSFFGFDIQNFANHISAPVHRSGDVTFLATAKLLLRNRAESFTASNITRRFPLTDNNEFKTTLMVNDCYDLAIYDFRIEKTETHREFDLCTSFLKDMGYEPLTDVDKYIAQHTFDSRFYINKEQKKAVVAVHKATHEFWQLMQSTLPVLLPWFFTDKPITQEEKNLLSALAGTDRHAYAAALGALIGTLDLRGDFIRNSLKGFDKAFVNRTIRELSDRVEAYDGEINRLEQAITEKFKRREELIWKIAGIEMSNATEESTELIDFFIASKSLFLKEVYGTSMTVEVKTPLDNYNPDVYERFRDNERSVFNNTNYYFGYSKEDALLLLDSIFKTQKIKVIMKGRFILDFGSGSVAIDREYSLDVRDYLANPHLTAYRCLGNNGPQLQQALRDRDYAMALSLCIAITGNLNLSETNNDGNFMDYLFHTRTKCIELEDGTLTTVPEAIAWLKERVNE